MLREAFDSITRSVLRATGNGGMMGGGMIGSATSADMSMYMDLFVPPQ